MKWIGGFLYVIAFVLLLDVVKRIITGLHAAGSFYIATIIICTQFFFITGFMLFWCFYKICSKYNVRRKWIWSGTGVIVLFIICELIFASLLDHPQSIPSWLKRSCRFYYDGYDCRLIQYQESGSVYDPQLFYILKPNATFNYRNREFNTVFYTNSRGVRDDEASLQSPEIICLGDSYALGWGVQQQETYAQHLEKISGMKVLNAGISSYGTAREMTQLKRFDTAALKYVIIQYCGNDLDENLSFKQHQSLSISSRPLFDSLVADQKLTGRYFPGKYSLLISQIFLKQQINKIFPVFSLPFRREELITDEKKHATAFLKVLSAAPVNFKRIKIIVLMLDSYTHKKNAFLSEVQKQLQQAPYRDRFEDNINVLDVAANLEENDYFELDLHIKATGHRKIADTLWKIISKK
jgi:lysophospholipase L1-like esterase